MGNSDFVLLGLELGEEELLDLDSAILLMLVEVENDVWLAFSLALLGVL